MAAWPGCPSVLATLRTELAEIGMSPMRGGGAYCLKLVPTTGKAGFEGVEDLRTLARTVDARVRLRDGHVELVPRGSNPAAALLKLLPRLGVGVRRAKSRLLVVPNTDLQSNLMYLGFRSVVTKSCRPETFRRATTAPRAFVSSTSAGRGFFAGLTHHFGWDRETWLGATAA